MKRKIFGLAMVAVIVLSIAVGFYCAVYEMALAKGAKGVVPGIAGGLAGVFAIGFLGFLAVNPAPPKKHRSQ